MRLSHWLWPGLLLVPLSAAADGREVDLRPPAPALFTGEAAFGDGEYTGPRTGPSDVRAPRATARIRGGCPVAPDGSERSVTGSVTTGIGHSSRGGTSHWNAADINLCRERVNADGDISTTNLQLRVGRYDGPGYPGGMYHGGFGHGGYGIGPGWDGPFDPWPMAAPVRRESWSEGRRPWR